MNFNMIFVDFFTLDLLMQHKFENINIIDEK